MPWRRSTHGVHHGWCSAPPIRTYWDATTTSSCIQDVLCVDNLALVANVRRELQHILVYWMEPALEGVLPECLLAGGKWLWRQRSGGCNEWRHRVIAGGLALTGSKWLWDSGAVAMMSGVPQTLPEAYSRQVYGRGATTMSWGPEASPEGLCLPEAIDYRDSGAAAA